MAGTLVGCIALRGIEVDEIILAMAIVPLLDVTYAFGSLAGLYHKTVDAGDYIIIVATIGVIASMIFCILTDKRLAIAALVVFSFAQSSFGIKWLLIISQL